MNAITPHPTHVVLEGAHRRPLPGARALSPVNPHSPINITIKLRRKKNLPELPGRPATNMTRDEIASDFGASPIDIQKVTDILERYGLTTVAANPATRTVEVCGPAAAIEKVFLV